MKTFNKILAELYKPNKDSPSNPESQFIHKHQNNTEFFIKNGKDYAGNSIDGPPYKGKVETYKRPPMHGYAPGQDAEKYS